MEIKVFGVVGAGQMGRGIAQVAAQSGLDVKLLDATKELADKGRGRIVSTLDRLVDRGKMEASERDAIAARIEASSDYDLFAQADMVVEAATENIELKQEIFRRADRAMQKSTGILASNTSSISLTKLAAVTGRPERVIGMHFMNPVPLMKLVEVVRALQTSDETYDRTMAVGATMG